MTYLPDWCTVVIPSRYRSGTIGKESLALFPDAIVTVDEAEMDDYARVVPKKQLLPHPGREALPTLPHIRNWMLQNVKNEVVVMCDDDNVAALCMVGWRVRKYKDPQTMAELVESGAVCARDAGAGLFGYGLNARPQFFDPQKPFRLNAGIGWIMGFVGDACELRCDPSTWLFEDMDYTLQSLLKHRIVWSDQRWYFATGRMQDGGSDRLVDGDDAHMARVDAGFRGLQDRWGQYVVRQPSLMGAGPRVQRTAALRP